MTPMEMTYAVISVAAAIAIVAVLVHDAIKHKRHS